MQKIINNRALPRLVLLLGVIMLALAPSPALAHDNLGGDELAVANWMLVFAMITVVIGALWAIWGLMNGQFDGIESSKYTMLDTADDYDTIMAEFDAEQRAADEAEAQSTTSTKTPAAGPGPVGPLPKPGGKAVNA
jgi:nitrogen fixation-related uncharacterized protein